MQTSPSLLSGGLHIPELGRNFTTTDLLYLNDYGALPENVPRRGASGGVECSQFSFWGKSSGNGGIIAGRNMDGENDFRKITVSHFTAFAVTPTEGERFVHFMWPGFVTVQSGTNEKGLYVMMNDGQVNPKAPAARKLIPFGFAVQQMMQRAVTVKETAPIAEEYVSDQGGTCPGGCNLHIVQGTTMSNRTHILDTPAAVLESDRAHNHWRLPGDAEPLIDTGMMVTNHELGPSAFSSREPLDNWGHQVC